MGGPSVALSLRLQDIAQSLDDVLADIAGDRIAFVLVLQDKGVSHYVSNTSRAEGSALIETLLERWREGRADIPAHYNPDLPR